MHFKAGYILDSIAKVITDFRNDATTTQVQLDQINGLLQHVTSFDVYFPDGHEPDFTKLNPVLATLNNIITRGLPTRAPVFLEELFADIGLTEPNKKEYEFDFPNATNPIPYENIFELLHIIEPQLNIGRADYGGNPGSNLEWDFISRHPFLKQILQSQRDFSTINTKLSGGRTVDFSFTAPYLHWNAANNRYETIGRIFEIDGHKSHFLSEGRYYDAYRDVMAADQNFETIRFTVEEIKTDATDFEALIGRTVYQNFQKNYNKKIEEHRASYSLLFIPLAVARIQKTILELFLRNPNLLNEKSLKIGIIERDLPCGAIAIQGLQDLFLNINALLEDSDKLELPEIVLTVFENKKWRFDEKLHLGASRKDEEYFKLTNFDIVIDHSILRRSDIYNEIDYKCDNAIKIRSSHYKDTSFGNERRVYCANLLKYKALVQKQDDGSYTAMPKYEAHINYFIQNIFRKKGFRAGQLPIISRALQQKPVIGLLPTGGGKSLTFQLPAFLQPGLCLVVDPIKSLMEDQVRVLKLNWIDCCDFINSNLKREAKAKKLIDFRYGETMFLFVSPERFVMQEFRDIIYTIDASLFGLAFSYCVIDEVHCVSEWGHDFRTTYLMLGKNAQHFAKTKTDKSVSLIGLTATASFDVLTDIERELSIKHDEINDAIISIDNTIRPELFFNYVENENRGGAHFILDSNLKNTIGAQKQALLNTSIGNIINTLDAIDKATVEHGLKQHFEEFEIENKLSDEDKAKLLEKTTNEAQQYAAPAAVNTLIFCPHITGSFGITEAANPFPAGKEVFETLIIPLENKGYFMGGDDKVPPIVIENAQKYFLDFVSGRISYMVCTKAFGMGIDKENIRSVFHLNLSSSPESYIQEAGRAGRDKTKSICSVIIDRNQYYTLSDNFIADAKNFALFPTFDIRRQARAIIENYNGHENRFYSKYYNDEASIIQAFLNIGINIDKNHIQAFNQDMAIHGYFHSNNFKGIETEMYQMNRLFNFKEGINSTQLKILQDKYNSNFDDDMTFNFSINPAFAHNLFFNNANTKSIGKVRTNIAPLAADIAIGAGQEPNLTKSQEILAFLIEEWQEMKDPALSFFGFLNAPIIIDLNEGLSLIEFFENSEINKAFEFKVPSNFNNNDLAQTINQDFTFAVDINYLAAAKSQSTNFEDYIYRIEEYYSTNLFGNTAFEAKRDIYKDKYYSDVKSADVSRMVYRLYSIGLVSDYTMDYRLNIFTFTIEKREKSFYIETTKNHLLKYLSRTETLKRIKKLEDITAEMSVFDTIKKCVRSILKFTYTDIVRKRKDAVTDLYKFIADSINKSKQEKGSFAYQNYWYNHYLKEDLYYYFNAKYARENFLLAGKPYSLTDDTQRGQQSDWNTFIKYAEVLNEQPSFISECKMIRGSCKRIWRVVSTKDAENEFVLKILYAFATYGLNNAYYYEEAEKFLIEGFLIYYNQNNYESLQSKIKEFEQTLRASTKNDHYIVYLNLAKHKIMMMVNLSYSQTIINQLKLT